MKKILIVAMLAMIAAPAIARDTSKDRGKRDPNKVVCKSSGVIGSRLQTKKTCMTVMQWDQLEREQRSSVERVQAFKPNNGS